MIPTDQSSEVSSGFKEGKYLSMLTENATQPYLESGYFVKVARLLVYMCPPTSMCTGALDLVS